MAQVATLIVTMVACPMNCIGAFHGSTATADEQLAGRCTCCHIPSAAGASFSKLSSQRDAPSNDRGCQTDGCDSCLCQGAVIGDDDWISTPDGRVGGAVPHVLHGVPVAVTLMSVEANERQAENWLPSGRSARIQYHSFLC